MSLDFVNDMLAALKKQGLQYYLIILDSDGKGAGNVHTFENLEIEEYPIVIETLGENIEVLDSQYEDFVKWMEKEMAKNAKREKKLKMLEKGPIDPSI